MTYRFTACFLLAGALTAGSLPHGTALDFEPGSTTVAFTLGDVLHPVHGTFRLKRGRIEFDPVTGAATGLLVVDAASGNSGSGARDKRMLKNVLETERYPDITFRPDRVEGTVAPAGASQVRVHGVFGIHGAEHEITIPAQVEASAGQLVATLTFPVPYVKWGMKDPSNFLLKVKDTVDIEIKTTARSAHE